MTRKLVFLDVETTGLDPATHQVWEIAYAVDDGEIRHSFVQHTLDGAESAALVVGRYAERHTSSKWDSTIESDLIEVLDGATLVGANPRFDAAFLKARWGLENWHYRLLDVCAYVAGARGLDYMPGLSDAAAMMGVLDEPDHTAGQDVNVTRLVYKAARNFVRGREWPF